MKKIMIVFMVLVASVFGCEYQDNQIEIGTIENYDFENDIEITTYREALRYTAKITNKTDLEIYEISEYWQTPEETYNLQSGDCEDICILLMYLLQNKLNIKSELYLIDKNNSGHAIIYVFSENEYVDICQNLIFRYSSIDKDKIIDIISYPKALWMAINYHHYI